MPEDLFLITNLKNDLIYRFSSANTKSKEKELLLLSYASLDIFDEIRREQAQYFYFSIDKHLKSKVSVLLLPSGYKIIFVNEWNDRNLIYQFLKLSHKIFYKVLIDFSAEDDCTSISNEIQQLYDEYSKKT